MNQQERDDIICTATRTLEKRKWAAWANVNPKFDIGFQFAADHVALLLEASVLTEVLETASAAWPRDWWEALKDRFAPKWFLSWLPVQYSSVELIGRGLYLKLASPKNASSIRIEILESVPGLTKKTTEPWPVINED